MLRANLAALLIAAAVTSPAAARPLKSLWAGRERVAQATVTLPAKGCAGVVVENDRRVLTAAHCVPEGAKRLDVVTRAGQRIAGDVNYLDPVADLALIDLDEAAPAVPLAVATALPSAGDRVLFVGRVDRKSRTQVARVTQLAGCPSLPGVDDAVFTTLQARPGDSGAPLVDDELRVVGLVHGGAACHIAAPTAALGRDLAAGAVTSLPAAPPIAPPEKTYRAGPFVFEKLRNGFRFHFELSWRSDR